MPVLLLAVLVFLVVVGPFLTIWMLNTLFPVVAIPYTFWTWCAAALFNMLFSGAVKVK